MNAPHAFPELAQDDPVAETLALIDAGQRPYGFGGYYDMDDWQEAADFIRYGEGDERLRTMIAHEEAFERYYETFQDMEDGPDFDLWRTHNEPSLGEYLSELDAWRAA